MNYELIKVCGMRDADNIRAVESLGINWMGFIFWPGSSRYVAERPAYLPSMAKRVGVFVDATIGDVLQHIVAYQLDIVQLHGHEQPGYLDTLRSASRGLTSAPSLIKAFSIASPADITQTESYVGKADYFLFDAKGKSVGGNGTQFDWTVLDDYRGETPFLLSGGIGPDDAKRLRQYYHPRCIGIDLNSRFETAPAIKDIQKLKTFINEQHQ